MSKAHRQFSLKIHRRDALRFLGAGSASAVLAACGGVSSGNWGEYAIGHHKMAVPPGFVPKGAKGVIDFKQLEVVRNYSGSPRNYLASMSENGGVLFQDTINGWLYSVVKEKIAEGVVSDFSVAAIGIQRIGSDLFVCMEQGIDIEKVPNPDDPRPQAFFRTAKLQPYSEPLAKKGFTYEGYVITGYPSGLVEDASVGLVADNSNLIDIYMYYGPLDRYVPLRDRSEISPNFIPGLSVEYGKVRINGQDGEYALLVEKATNEGGYNMAAPGVSGNYQKPEFDITYIDTRISLTELKSNMLKYTASIAPV